MIHFILLLFISASSFACQNFVLIGAPGSGKGTFSSFMIQNYGYHQICPGDILRSHIKERTELGKEIAPIVQRGDYIDDAIVLNIIEQQIDLCLEQKKPFIIDGFPRSETSFNQLQNIFNKKRLNNSINFIHLQIDDQTCIERIDSRLVCLKCASVFNKTTKQPLENMVCDNCKTKLEIRLGDNTENTKKRLNYYRANIEPLAEYAKKSGFTIYTFDTKLPTPELLCMYQSLIEKFPSFRIKKKLEMSVEQS